MPQPLSRVKPVANAYIGVSGVSALFQRPQLAVLAMEVISSYSTVEGYFLKLFIEIFGGNKTMAAKMYLALDTKGPKTAALRAAVDTLKDERIKDVIIATMGLGESQRLMRDKLAHHQWGYSPELPDALLLADPIANLETADRDKIFVYREIDFKNIIEANQRLSNYGYTLLLILGTPFLNRDNRLVDDLCNQSEIRDRLPRPASQAQTGPQERY